MSQTSAKATVQRTAPSDSVRSDSKRIAHGKNYQLALRFNRKRRGIAAFDWVAVWRMGRASQVRAFPLEAHGFAEALRGAVAMIELETGLVVPQDEVEIAGYKERRVNEYLRLVALEDAHRGMLDAPSRTAPAPLTQA